MCGRMCAAREQEDELQPWWESRGIKRQKLLNHEAERITAQGRKLYPVWKIRWGLWKGGALILSLSHSNERIVSAECQRTGGWHPYVLEKQQPVVFLSHFLRCSPLPLLCIGWDVCYIVQNMGVRINKGRGDESRWGYHTAKSMKCHMDYIHYILYRLKMTGRGLNILQCLHHESQRVTGFSVYI